MGLFERLFGTDDNYSLSEDESAVERYHFLVSTAPPETVEEVRTEAFANLTEDQRDLLLEQLSHGESGAGDFGGGFDF